MLLVICIAGRVIARQIPSIARFVYRREERFSFREDITYKLDEKF
jgi:hypothetical protein